MLLFLLACCFSLFPMGSPWHQHLCHGAASRHRAPASSVFPMALRIGTSARSCFPMLPHRPSWSISRRAATSSAQISAAAPLPVSSSAAAPRPATALPRRPCQHLRLSAPASNIFPMALCHGTPASNKPHPAEKSTPVWLAIWRTWARFANSQHRDAAFTTPNNICAHSFLLPHWAAAQTDANLSAHLHRLPTPPSYLSRMRLLPGRGRRCWVLDMAAAWPGAAFLQITARTNPCSRHLWGTLARAVASI